MLNSVNLVIKAVKYEILKLYPSSVTSNFANIDVKEMYTFRSGYNKMDNNIKSSTLYACIIINTIHF